MDDIDIDRDHIFWRALAGEFDLVIFADIWNTFGIWSQWGPMLKDAQVPMAVIDGSDRVEPYPYAGQWWRRPSWWFLPRAHNRAPYFKRELMPLTRWFASYLMLPPAFGRTLGLQTTSFAIPAEKIVEEPPPKVKDFPAHVVDRELAERIDASVGYAFSTEAEYYSDLRDSRYGITTKREGWDALRHYEIAANGAVPCFRDLALKPELCAPHGLDATNCLAYRDADHLLEQIASIDARRYAELQAGALRWARASTTAVRAQQLLAACGIPVQPLPAHV